MTINNEIHHKIYIEEANEQLKQEELSVDGTSFWQYYTSSVYIGLLQHRWHYACNTKETFLSKSSECFRITTN